MKIMVITKKFQLIVGVVIFCSYCQSELIGKVQNTLEAMEIW